MKLEVKRPERLVELCLDGELHAKYQALQDDYSLATRKNLGDSRLADDTMKLSRELVALGDQIRESSVKFLIRGMPRKRWATLTAENPARPDEAMDKPYGFNLEAVMVEAIPESIVAVTDADGEPVEFNPSEDWEDTADDMTNIQYEDFVLAVLTVNRGRQEVPFSLDAYRRINSSDKK